MSIRRVEIFRAVLALTRMLRAQGPRRPFSGDEAEHRVDVEQQLDDAEVLVPYLLAKRSLFLFHAAKGDRKWLC